MGTNGTLALLKRRHRELQEGGAIDSPAAVPADPPARAPEPRPKPRPAGPRPACVATAAEKPPPLAELIVAAACTMPQPFTVSELVVTCWRAFPGRFGLPDWRSEYPDSNKVIAALSGDRGMVRRGLLVRVERGVYRLAHDARRRLAERRKPGPKPWVAAGERVRVPEEA